MVGDIKDISANRINKIDRKVGDSILNKYSNGYQRFTQDIIKLLDYKFDYYLAADLVGFKLLISFTKSKVFSSLDYLKGLEVVSFLSNHSACFEIDSSYGHDKLYIKSDLRKKDALKFLWLLMRKYLLDEEFKLLFRKNKFDLNGSLSRWNFGLKNVPGLFDLSSLEYDYYMWKYTIQVEGRFSVESDIFLFNLFSAYSIFIK